MRETKFIKDNQEKWSEYEKTLKKDYQDPDKLNEIFVNITDDLSYARTFYKNRSVRVYLNGLAQNIFLIFIKINAHPFNDLPISGKKNYPNWSMMLVKHF